MDKIMVFINTIIDFLRVPIFSVGQTSITIWTLVYLFLLFLLLHSVTTRVIKLVVYKLFAKSKIEIGVRVAIGSIIKYLIFTIGTIIILQTVGINLSSLTILFGALGVGIGFGLQNITNNFVSGLIILFERPIKVGDRIEVGGIAGNVVNISMRSTIIITNDNISIIVPNSEFVSSTVTNWSHHDRNIRFNFKVGVSYKEDPEKIKNLLMEVASETPGVQKFPAPDVLFSEYDDSALIFNLRVWTSSYIDRPGVLKSLLYYEIFKKFKKEGVEIPFPQRDIHIKQMPERDV